MALKKEAVRPRMTTVKIIAVLALLFTHVIYTWAFSRAVSDKGLVRAHYYMTDQQMISVRSSIQHRHGLCKRGHLTERSKLFINRHNLQYRKGSFLRI